MLGSKASAAVALCNSHNTRHFSHRQPLPRAIAISGDIQRPARWLLCSSTSTASSSWLKQLVPLEDDQQELPLPDIDVELDHSHVDSAYQEPASALAADCETALVETHRLAVAYDWTSSEDTDINDASQSLLEATFGGSQCAVEVGDDPVLTSLHPPSQSAVHPEHSNNESTVLKTGSKNSSGNIRLPSASNEPSKLESPTKSQEADAIVTQLETLTTPPLGDTTSAAAATAPHSSNAGQTAGEGTEAEAVGSFFASRTAMLLALRQQQLEQHRDHLLRQQQRPFYRYTLADDGSSIVKAPGLGPISPTRQKVFPLAKQLPGFTSSNSSSNNTAGGTQASANLIQQQVPPVAQVGSSALEQPDIQQQHQQQQVPAADETSRLPSYLQDEPTQQEQQSGTPGGFANAAAAQVSAAGANADPSRGLCLSAFLYCCSRSQLLSLTWQLGLPPAALKFVPRVSDADVVLHVKPGPRERHYQYDEYRSQAAAKGIPFVDLKCLSLLELQLYLLPIFRLYAGELSPRDLLVRQKRRGRKWRYTNIKLPPVPPA